MLNAGTEIIVPDKSATTEDFLITATLRKQGVLGILEPVPLDQKLGTVSGIHCITDVRV